MDTAVVIASISTAGTAVVGFLAYRSNKRAGEAADRAAQRAAEVEGSKVDQAAYNNAISFYEKTLAQVSAQVDRLSAQLDKVSSQLAAEKDASNRLRDEVWTLERRLKELSTTVEESNLNPLAPKRF